VVVRSDFIFEVKLRHYQNVERLLFDGKNRCGADISERCEVSIVLCVVKPNMPIIGIPVRIGIWRGLSKGVEDCEWATPERPVRLFQRLPTGCKRVRYCRPGRNFRESMATPCHTLMQYDC
jgi:hypothetical protein